MVAHFAVAFLRYSVQILIDRTARLVARKESRTSRNTRMGMFFSIYGDTSRLCRVIENVIIMGLAEVKQTC